MMTKLTQIQAQRLCELVHLMRPEWDIPGIAAHVRIAAQKAPAAELASALFALAARPDVTTPALITKPGSWWPKGDSYSGLRVSHDQPCPVPGHNDQTAGTCRTCHAERDREHPPPEFIAAIKAEVARAIADNPPPAPRRTGDRP